MKVRNAVVDMEVQVKHDCRGHLKEFIKKGLVCTIKWIDEEDGEGYELCLLNPDIVGGFAWVNASDVRRYTEPTESPKPVIGEGDIVELREDCTAKHGELIPQGLYIVGGVDKSDDTCEVLTVHGGYGQGSLPMAKVRKVGVCNDTSG